METDLGRVGALRYMQSREERVRERLIQKRVRGMDDAKKNRLNGIFREAESLYRREEYREAGRRYDEIILAMTQLRYDVDAEIQSRLEREERAVSLFEKAEILYNRGEYARAKEIYAEVLLLASS
jgi:tetratricopeptide (TPR) repeat protein